MSSDSRRPNIGLTLTGVAIIAGSIAYLYASMRSLNEREADADDDISRRVTSLENGQTLKVNRRWALLTGVVSSLVVVVLTTHPHISF